MVIAIDCHDTRRRPWAREFFSVGATAFHYEIIASEWGNFINFAINYKKSYLPLHQYLWRY